MSYHEEIKSAVARLRERLDDVEKRDFAPHLARQVMAEAVDLMEGPTRLRLTELAGTPWAKLAIHNEGTAW